MDLTESLMEKFCGQSSYREGASYRIAPFIKGYSPANRLAEKPD